MNAERTFTNVDDEVLVKLISRAARRVMFVAPGLRKAVADALADALHRMPGKVTVVLDVEAEVCRLGYGDEEGLVTIKQAVEKAGMRLYHQGGVRIGLLIADDATIIYSPAPLLIETGSKISEKPNAIVLNGVVPAAVESACGLGAEPDSGREVGMEFVKEAALEAVKEDLKANPPREFDIVQIERVFNSALHFVELEFLDYRLRAKKVTLGEELSGLGDDFLRERIETTFKPFDDAEFLTLKIPKLDADGQPVPEQKETFGPDTIERERKQIKKEFLFDIPRFGVVMLRASKKEFEARITQLEARLKLYTAELQKNIVEHVGKAKEKLKKSLLGVVMKNPPPVWRKFMVGGQLSEDEADRLLTGALDRAFAGITSDFNPTIRWIYKDLTYETIHNAAFRQGLEKQLGKPRADKLFGEHDAAPEK